MILTVIVSLPAVEKADEPLWAFTVRQLKLWIAADKKSLLEAKDKIEELNERKTTKKPKTKWVWRLFCDSDV